MKMKKFWPGGGACLELPRSSYRVCVCVCVSVCDDNTLSLIEQSR